MLWSSLWVTTFFINTNIYDNYMAFLSGKNNNFKFSFPKLFVPKEIEDKYSPILNRIPGNMCTTVVDFLNYSIKSVELEVNPVEYEPIEQVDRGTPYGRLHRSDFFPDFLWKKSMTIIFQHAQVWKYWTVIIIHYIELHLMICCLLE